MPNSQRDRLTQVKWTKQHSQNAVAAKERRRMMPEKVAMGARPVVRFGVRQKARFTLQLRDHLRGDSLTLKMYPSPWLNRWITSAGSFSSAQFGRKIALMLGSG
jgi:hypothetical protein